jgi:hypothetical protein
MLYNLCLGSVYDVICGVLQLGLLLLGAGRGQKNTSIAIVISVGVLKYMYSHHGCTTTRLPRHRCDS